MKKCLNDWNATIEALGNGKQTILIRKYGTTLKEFFLYPTISYVSNKDYLDSFQNEHRSFAKKNALPKRDGKKFEVKYFAEVEKVIKKSPSQLGSLKNFSIWAPNHIKSYVGKATAYIWILRVYRLKKPVMVERTNGIRYANLLEPVSIEGIKPIISDSEYTKLVHEI